jgi:pyruvate/2-oxoglutarate/acetoin dehydrogenase E1 component|tara:strand:+ start:5779 stop:6309 length:531 start_codon:yes stop_codon:yes gene_type:complete
MKYKEQLIKSMEWLGKKENTIFLGQATLFSGHAISGTLTEVPKEKLIELPVMEEVQMGMCTGLSLEGYVPISIYPRFNFMMLSINQLVNHIDTMRGMSKGELVPRVIVRVAVGAKKPLDGGSQHTQDFTESIKAMLTDTVVVELEEPEQIFSAFQDAYYHNGSTVLIEYGDYYAEK